MNQEKNDDEDEDGEDWSSEELKSGWKEGYDGGRKSRTVSTLTSFATRMYGQKSRLSIFGNLSRSTNESHRLHVDGVT